MGLSWHCGDILLFISETRKFRILIITSIYPQLPRQSDLTASPHHPTFPSHQRLRPKIPCSPDVLSNLLLILRDASQRAIPKCLLHPQKVGDTMSIAVFFVPLVWSWSLWESLQAYVIWIDSSKPEKEICSKKDRMQEIAEEIFLQVLILGP